MRLLTSLCVLGAFTAVLSSCKNGSSEITQEASAAATSAFTGGNKVFRIAESTAPSSIFPHRLTHVTEGLIAGQIFEGLVKLNPKTMEIVPGLAESWEISADGKSITFHLRKGIKFHPCAALGNKEVELTSKDVKFTFELLCTEGNNNLHFATVCKDRIVGANECYDISKSGQTIGLKGFKIIDDYNFTIELMNSPAIFLDILGNPVAGIISMDAYKAEKGNTKVGAGPFVFDAAHSTPAHYALYKNVAYYAKDKNGNALPYLDSIVVDIVPSSEIAWEGFKSGKFDFISSIPVNQLKQIVEENISAFKGENPPYVLERSAEMMTQYYLFNIHKAPFNDVRVRKAFNYAIDKEKLIEKVLMGQAYGPANNGIVPPTFSFYNTAEVEGYKFDVDKAKKLLAEAGFANGKDFPSLQLIVNSGKTLNNTVAAEIQKQLLMNLNVNVNFESLPNSDKFLLQTSGQGDMFRDGWIADYPSPESFLSVFYGEPVEKDTAKISYPNTIRYVNKDFDIYYEKGRDALTRDSAAVYFLKAEKILMDEAPLLPLYYESNYNMISSHLVNFYLNPLHHFDFTEVDLKERAASTSNTK